MRARKFVAFLAFLALFLYLLRTSLFNGFWWDDIALSLKYGTSRLTQVPLGRETLDEIRTWLGNGRFFPIAVAQLNFFQYLGHGEREIVRSIQFGLVLFNVLQVFFFLKSVSKGFYFSLLTAFLFIPLVQYRISPGTNYVEPVSGLAALMQVCFLFMLSSVQIAYLGFETQKRRLSQFYLGASALLAVLSALTYEIGLISFLMVGLISWSKSKPFNFPKLLRLNFYNLGFLIIYLSFTIAVRLGKSGSYEGVEIGEAKYLWHGFIVQLVATLPMTYAILLDQHKLLEPWHVVLSSLDFAFAFFGISTFTLVALLFCRRETQPSLTRHQRSTLKIVGCTLFFAPCFAMGISKGYQTSQVMGMAYLPVYLSYFGLAIALGCCMRRLNGRENSRPRQIALGLLVFAFAFLGGVQSYFNSKVFDFLEDAQAYERDAVYESIKAGFLSDLHEDAVVFSKIKLLYNTQSQFRALAATAQERPPYFLYFENSNELPSAFYRDKTVYLLEGAVDKRRGAWLALSRLELPQEAKADLSRVSFCEKPGRYLRLINLTSTSHTENNAFIFRDKNSLLTLDSAHLEARPIVGNPLRRLFRDKRLNNQYQWVDLSKNEFKPCSIQVQQK